MNKILKHLLFNNLNITHNEHLIKQYSSNWIIIQKLLHPYINKYSLISAQKPTKINS